MPVMHCVGGARCSCQSGTQYWGYWDPRSRASTNQSTCRLADSSCASLLCDRSRLDCNTVYVLKGPAMTSDLVECLASLPGLVSRLDGSQASRDINSIGFLTARTEEYLELILLLSGKSNFILLK